MDNSSQKEKEDHLNQWKASGLSKKEYCEHSGINYWAFKRWCYQYGYVKKRDSRPQTEFIQLKPGIIPTREKIEVIYPNGIRILLPLTNNKELLRSLVNM